MAVRCGGTLWMYDADVWYDCLGHGGVGQFTIFLSPGCLSSSSCFLLMCPPSTPSFVYLSMSSFFLFLFPLSSKETKHNGEDRNFSLCVIVAEGMSHTTMREKDVCNGCTVDVCLCAHSRRKKKVGAEDNKRYLLSIHPPPHPIPCVAWSIHPQSK